MLLVLKEVVSDRKCEGDGGRKVAIDMNERSFGYSPNLFDLVKVRQRLAGAVGA